MASNQAKVILHWLDGSRAQRILWLLNELKVPHELKIYHREKTAFAPPELAKIHPLGKSPVITVIPPASAGADAKELVIAESGFIIDYLCEHWGHNSSLVPKKWKDGQEGAVGGETAAWLRYQYLLYYAEGSLMPFLVFSLVTSNLRGPQVLWLIRPISSAIANKINNVFIVPNVRKNLELLESYLTTPPAEGDGTGYICGDRLTAADIMLSYPLFGVRERAGGFTIDGKSFQERFPKTMEYLGRLENEPGYLESVETIKKLEGKFEVLPDSM
ncbi:glutathione S-transferase [Sporothrix brasiliensis 5110]|uniref:Glutathione S-transferase n=1 Tax=Sporothrix brasiliensis 5110 TaxID=1398154 RepID=A0A0C2IVD8_9PEZI|nr:glutathione S-transferase [Sporothrix brasiliensis 5110]KIH93101.1 glutathione S-transferase [Sporothrix brasiliensis 5110]